MLDSEEVVTIEREEWRSVETNSGGECVMMNGMKETRLLCVDNWDFRKKVYSHPEDLLISCSMNISGGFRGGKGGANAPPFGG